MLNSALRYLTRSGVNITLQRGETGVVLTLQGIGIHQKENGATRLIPLVVEPALPTDSAPLV